MPTPNPYTPIDCAFYDRLEHWAMRAEPVEVVWRDGPAERRATARVADVYAAGGADYMRLEDGTVIRLDHLVSVGGIALPDAC